MLRYSILSLLIKNFYIYRLQSGLTWRDCRWGLGPHEKCNVRIQYIHINFATLFRLIDAFWSINKPELMNIIQTYIKSYLEHAGNFCISRLGKLSFKQFSPPPPLRLSGLKRAHARRPQLVAVLLWWRFRTQPLDSKQQFNSHLYHLYFNLK